MAHFDALRRRHFPPARNVIAAHVTLFHKLPGEDEAAIRAMLARESAEWTGFTVQVRPPRLLGYGVAFDLDSAELLALHADLAARFAEVLSPQDRQRFRPHVTVQNKVTPEEARHTCAMLSDGFAPFAFQADGLALWRYQGGPWEPAGEFRFRRGPERVPEE
ncbi:2'-5' RNA ligase family protein [Xaviernesmea oryzae]|nr:2'-5' RNA ligase family protein [Xaviernesmea oryzae]SEK82644.1 2'-5' RNA ligase superfamily protein [Xaviernesmea oryzae]